MNDRELLEAAAKAAGMPVEWDTLCDVDSRRECMIYISHAKEWNPLADDGDALRLANKLWLDVRHVHGKVHAGMQGKFWCTEGWFTDGNQDAATRRAIVRAAAALGGATGAGDSHE